MYTAEIDLIVNETTVTDKDMTISVDLPGVKLEDLEVSVEGTIVQVVAKRGEKVTTRKWDIRADFNPCPVATLEAGVLVLVFEKRPEKIAQRVTVPVNQKT